MHLIALAGLPGAGKSTLARALADRLGAPVLDKDRLREALFGPAHVEYSREQDDHCVGLLLATCAWLARTGRARHALLDGRTFGRRADVEGLRAFARETDVALLLVECTCAPDEARARLAADRAAGTHPARDRDAALYDRLARAAEPIEPPRLVVPTDRLPLERQVERVLAELPGYST